VGIGDQHRDTGRAIAMARRSVIGRAPEHAPRMLCSRRHAIRTNSRTWSVEAPRPDAFAKQVDRRADRPLEQVQASRFTAVTSFCGLCSVGRGSLGTASFENEPASEWFLRVEEAVEPGAVMRSALDAALGDADYLGLDAACEAR
jgi:hypothetical protein